MYDLLFGEEVEKHDEQLRLDNNTSIHDDFVGFTHRRQIVCSCHGDVFVHCVLHFDNTKE